MPEICKTDIRTCIRFLEDAVKSYQDSKSTAIANRIRLINILTQKLKTKLDDQVPSAVLNPE